MPLGLEKNGKSAITEDVHSTVKMHEVDQDSLCISERALWKRDQKIIEAVYIRKRKWLMNKHMNSERHSLGRGTLKSTSIKVCHDLSINQSLRICHFSVNGPHICNNKKEQKQKKFKKNM